MTLLRILVGFGCLLSPAEPTENVEKAVQRVRALKGTVEFAEDLPGKPVVRVDLTRTLANDDDVKALTAFRSLRSLNLTGVPISLTGMRQLHRFPQLERLVLREVMGAD